ncbi:MAG: phage shock protein A [Gammaproteobacteria bacterium]|jgi:phage shock protein A
MALINRISRLFKADFHAVLDQIEEPDLQLKQAIREMTVEAQSNEEKLTLLQQQAGDNRNQFKTWSSSLVKISEELDLCFAANDEALARDTIRRKLETENLLESSNLIFNSLKISIDGQEKQLSEQRLKLNNMNQKLELLVRKNTVQIDIPNSRVRQEDIDIALLREKQQRFSS